ncbi:leucine-rich repeat flightless-interacting protein 1 isoform X47 [Trachypithecus francoisi]|nr:leucine-rich repeat flightless-interacting protein 1 isoform X47 [Trachypithecus francoisi]
MGRAEAPEAPESRFPCALPPPAVLSPAATCAPPLPATPEPSAASLALEGWLLAPEAGALISLRVAPSPRTERAPAGPAREGLPAWSPSVSRRVERAQPGRMTSPAAAQSREIDCLSPEAQRLAEARLAAKRAARAEAREIRMKELERQQKEVEDRPEKDFTEKGSRNMPGLSAATLASLGGTSSRRGSGDTSISIDTEASIREIKDSLAEVEEKYKKAMVSNAQLDNEKTNFMYQVDTLKDMMLELEEQLAESRRQYEEKNKEFEREKHAHSILQFQFAEVKEALKQREEMLEKHGIILNSEIATNGETSDTLNNFGYQGPSKMTKEELNALKSTGDGTLDIRLKKLVDERECLLEQIKKLKGQLEERQKIGKLDNLRSEDDVLENGTDMHVMDLQRDANRQISDLKFKLAKSEQEITALEQNVIRLESQVSRYKSAAENAEKIEDELKAEKRKLQRELRSALDKTEELEVSNGHLVKRLEKMKANRSALLSQQ